MSLKEQILNCRDCELWEAYKQPVPFEGNPNASLMLVGRDPGADEVRLLRPFVGDAGQILNEVLAEVPIAREEVYIANTCCCKPPKNLPYTRNQYSYCADRHLAYAICQVQPRMVVSLGKEATEYMLCSQIKSMTATRGKVYMMGVPVIPTWHPSYILRQRGTEGYELHKNEMINDIRMALKICQEGL